jgi:flagellar basal body rod protein FlgG
LTGDEKNTKLIYIMFNKKFYLLLILFSIQTIHADIDAYFDYEYLQLQPEFRELNTARDAYKEMYLKTIQYIANSQTPGYIKKKVRNTREFNHENGLYDVVAHYSLEWIEGITMETGRPLYFAIDGHNRAFFTLQLHDQKAYTRDGRFRIDGKGRLVSLSGNFPVLNEDGGFINVINPNGDISASKSGALYNDNEFIGRIGITVFKTISDMDRYLVSLNSNLFILSAEIETLKGVENYKVLQGFVQMTNTFFANDQPLYTNFFNASTSVMEHMLSAQKTNFSILQP